MAWLYSSLKGDKALYLLMTQNFLQGKGLTESVSLVETGYAVNLYDGGVHSPLYPLLCAPFLWLTNSYFITQLLVGWVGWIGFFIGLYRLASLLLPHRWVVNLFILCVGGFIYPQEMQSAPKDTIAAALTIWCIVLIHRFVTLRPTALLGAGIGAVLVGICSIKLLYVPIAIALFASALLLALAKWTKRAILPIASLIVALFAGGCIYAYLVLPYYTTTMQPFVLPGDSAPHVKGVFLQNLSAIYPFLSSAIVETHLVAMQADLIREGSFTKAMQTFRWVDVLLIAILTGVAARYFNRIRKNKTGLLLTAASLAITAAVVYQSISEAPIIYKSASAGWTYVSDARSFLVPMLAVQLLLFRFVAAATRWLALRLFLAVLFVGSAAHGYLFSVKKFIATPFVAEANVNRDGLKKGVDYLKAQNTGEDTVALITSDKALRRYAQIHGLKAYSFSNRDTDLSWMKRGDRFVVATHVADSAYLQKLPVQGLEKLDGIAPFILHRFTR